MSANVLEYVVKPGDRFVFLRDVIKHELGISRSLLATLKAQHRIQVNGQTARTDYRLQIGDRVAVDIGFEEVNRMIPLPMLLDVIYEDLDLLVINKTPGLPVHPGSDPAKPTLANAVAYYWENQEISPLFRPINRLDKDTSGLVLIAKSQFAHQAVFQQMKRGLVARFYQALVLGNVKEEAACINLPIAHLDRENSPARSVDPSGKPAVTKFKVLKRYDGFTLLSLSLETGRTHQIRVHLSHIGHSLVGDTLYGIPSGLINRQALHSGKVELSQPRTGCLLRLEAPLPADILNCLRIISVSQQ